MQSILKSKPVYFLLLPLFFVFHGYTENYDFIPVKDALLLVLVFLLSSCVIGMIPWFIYRNLSKAALVSFYVMSFYFFFGYLYDNLYSIDPRGFFSKYSVIISFFSLGFIVLFIFLFRYKGSLIRLNYIFNVFFVCLLLVDMVWLSMKIIDKPKPLNPHFAKTFTLCDSCSRPDIYLIVADEYAGDRQLKEAMNFDNNNFKEQLRKSGFCTPTSISNYNFTPFSIASMLQMEYLSNIEGSNTDHNDLSLCYNNIRENHVFRFLALHGYRFYNYSIFDIHDQPSILGSSVLPERTKFITAQTLFNRFEKDILFNIAGRLGIQFKTKRLLLAYHSNIKAIDSIKAVVHKKSSVPKFVYTHLIMPHFPYYFTKSGAMRPISEIEFGKEVDTAKYLEYVQYTNNVLLNIINEIMAKSAHPPIVILVSDHGFREDSFGNQKYQFMNQLCVYLPDHHYQPFYNGISNVNLFRVLFNTEFNQKFQLLADSTHYINP